MSNIPSFHRPSRFSPKRLSLDTLPPGYTSTSPRSQPAFSDQPPEYPDSADDADHEEEISQPLLQRRPSTSLNTYSAPSSSSHHRSRTRTTQLSTSRSHSNFYRSKKAAASESYLDSLLERSVHALEISNALLQSSMPAPHPPPQPSYIPEHYIDHSLQMRANKLNHRIQDSSQAQSSWMDDLDDLVLGVEELFGDGRGASNNNGAGISSSLPSAGPGFSQRHNRGSVSVGSRSSDKGDSPRLRLSIDSSYKSPPPRALTQYVSADSCHDEDSFDGSNHETVLLPSTIGLRSTSHIAELPSPPIKSRRRSYSHDFTPHLAKFPSEPSTPSHARSFLSNLTSRSQSSADALPFVKSHYGSQWAQSPPNESLRRGRSGSNVHSTSSRESSMSRRSGSPIPTLEIRPMTPPLEEPTPPSSASSADDDTSQALESLRRILKDAPRTDEPTDKRLSIPPPSLIHRSHSTPSEPQELATTASISRLLTKATHHSSTTAPPPKHSSLKQPMSPLLSSGQLSPVSAPSSGRSTPRLKVQFAELPESYSSTRGGPKMSSKSRSKKGKKKEEPPSWWKSFWTLGDTSSGSTFTNARGSRFEERIEDKVARSWGRSGFGNGSLDDWTI